MTFVLRKFAFYGFALLAALTLNFALPRLMPGHPYDYLLAQYRGELTQNPAYLNSLKIELGGSKAPLLNQYGSYLKNMATLDFGISTSHYPSTVREVLGGTVPWTLFLAGSATILSFLVGTFLGVVVAWRRGGVLDSLLPPITMFLAAFPPFFLGLVAVYFLALKAGWFPLQHSYGGSTPGFNWPFIVDASRHAALPMLVMLAVSVGGWLLGMRNVMVGVMRDDYVTMAEAKGLTSRRVMLMYAARNAILPNLTGFAIACAYIVGGVVLVETVFSYPGVGLTLVNAALARDFPLVQAVLLFIAVAVLTANLAVDLLYVRLDPRAR